MNDLIWDLFMKVRELMPATPANGDWANDWSARFRAATEARLADDQPAVAEHHDDLDGDTQEDLPDEDLHPIASARKRKKK